MSYIDAATSTMLLEAAKVDPSKLADLYKLFTQNEGGPTQAAKDWFTAHEGRSVRIVGTGDYVGTVLRLNNSERGIYNGGRYPIVVKLTAGACSRDNGTITQVAGMVFEYGIEQLELIEHD